MSGAGRIYLVGAGPGDPELLTLKAVRVLGKADVVLVDELVNPAILAHARPGARVVQVGKRGGCKSTPQAFIEKLMVAEALAGNTVVRLKGGDPFVFGRGGEEWDAATAAGVRIEAVNGITAGLAAASVAGIALTHRAACRGVVFVTGHTAHGDAPEWRALAKARMTVVVYMAVSACASLEAALREAGWPPGTPVAMLENATLPEERRLFTQIDGMGAFAQEHALRSPAIMVIGEVVREAARADCAARKPPAVQPCPGGNCAATSRRGSRASPR